MLLAREMYFHEQCRVDRANLMKESTISMLMVISEKRKGVSWKKNVKIDIFVFSFFNKIIHQFLCIPLDIKIYVST